MEYRKKGMKGKETNVTPFFHHSNIPTHNKEKN